MEEAKENYGYSKRPLWQWVVIYLIIGAVLYGLIYYFAVAKNGGYNSTSNQTPTIPTSQNVAPTSKNTNTAPSDNIYKTATDVAKGDYLTDFQGMTLYIFDKDTTGVSNCYSTCAVNWPSYSSAAAIPSQLPENITVVTRTDGSQQFAWKGMPLYYYAADKKAGDITGDGVDGVWHLVKP